MQSSLAPQHSLCAIKLAKQQALRCVHRLREGYKEERTACINRIRGLLTEYGLGFAQSPEVLRLALQDTLEDASNESLALAPMALQRAHLHWTEIECHITWCDKRISVHVRTDAQAKAAGQLCGIGPVTASALLASVGDFTQFKTKAQFGAWLGLVLSQKSSGGRHSDGSTTVIYPDVLKVSAGVTASPLDCLALNLPSV